MTGATGATGAGPWPGTEPLEAQTVVLGELGAAPDGVTGLPFTAVLDQRGPWADLVGRSLGLLVDLPAELGPHGWRLSGRPGTDLTRSRAFLRDDLDALAIAAHGWSGPLVVPVAGPVTVAARVDLPRGDRLLSDPGALRDVADSLGAGLADHLSALVRAVPGARPTVLLHEPLAAAAIEAQVPTFSGRATLRAVPVPVVAERLRAVVTAARDAGAAGVAVHIGSSAVALPAVTASGADAVAVDVGAVDARGWEVLAGAVEGGTRLWAQLAATARSAGGGPDAVRHADQLLRPWSTVGLAARRLEQVVLVAGGGSDPRTARTLLTDTVRAAQVVAERAAR